MAEEQTPSNQNAENQNAENIVEGAKPKDTVAETAKPDADAKNLEQSDDKKSGEPVAKVKEDSGETAKAGNQPAGKTVGSGGSAKKPAAKSEAKSGDKKPAAKKKKPPKLEDKPFNEFMEQHYLPSLKEAMAKEGIEELNLEFAKRKLEVMGQSGGDPYWQVQGQWTEAGEGDRQFNIAFIDEDISGQKVFTLTSNGAVPSTVEQFMGDERRITLDLMVLYTLQRLNGQKWLTRN
ncbi:hypothetical protein S7335_3919 [Synechococcus sp. PCC 7335]|uniref:DUF2996 domain-containing protein n=1 Tax=Synechococcus sp. (strain ATCC 29403 / PCC 7335) TaxID=91464 RepID=UPI00017ED643|nr:DUF2996 domain-containing protein [Synechococcus sp. PCC 7335]EDX86216.1 hypothetical protein S7335_3919 [Synechococcus sp. PCC 7335]